MRVKCMKFIVLTVGLRREIGKHRVALEKRQI